MNFKYALSLFTVVFFCSIVAVLAQTPPAGKGSVSGKLTDASNSQPLEFATIALVKKADNMPAKAIQTDLQGNFKLDNIADGLYLLRATYVGYSTFTKDSVLVGPKKRVFVFNNIKLKETKGLLKEVSVKAQRSAIQLGVDKKVFSVDQSLVSQGGSATDLLSNVPSVQVDVDGNLNLRGSSNVRVLINGKPSSLTGSSMTDILQSIPASSIENIEVITNPSSKYDAEGQSGIINIILKKNARLGFNGSASFSAGNRNTYNGSANIAYQNKGINVYANYSYRKANRVGNGFTNRVTLDSLRQHPTYQDQIADQSLSFLSHNVRAGIDVDLDPKTTLSFSFNGNFRDRTRYQSGNTTVRDSTGKLTQLTGQDFKSVGPGNHNLDYNIDFDHKYKKGELTANVGYSRGRDTFFDTQLTNYAYYLTSQSRSHYQTNNNYGREHNINLQVDLTQPLEHNNKLDVGYRSTFSENDNANEIDSLIAATNSMVPDLTLTNHFLYQEQVHAAYGTYQQQFGKYGVQVGARLEDARIRTLLRDNGERHGQDYFRIYPSVFLSDKISDNQTLQVSYTRRVSRPRGWQISPFLDKSDPFNYNQGNPNLKPEDTHSFEMSYINYWRSLTLTSSLYYRLTNDNIQRIRTPVDSAITLMQFRNIKSASNGGFEFIAKLTATQNLDLTANVNAYYSYLQAVPEFDLPSTSGFAWNANLTANIKPVKKLGLQLRGDYNAPQVISQGRQRAMYGMDAGLRYDLTKSVSISGNVRDVFDSRKFGSIIDYNSGKYPYHLESVRRFQSRVMLFTVSYRFGSAPDEGKKKGKKKDNNNDDNNGGGGDDGGNGQAGGPPPAAGSRS